MNYFKITVLKITFFDSEIYKIERVLESVDNLDE